MTYAIVLGAIIIVPCLSFALVQYLRERRRINWILNVNFGASN